MFDEQIYGIFGLIDDQLERLQKIDPSQQVVCNFVYFLYAIYNVQSLILAVTFCYFGRSRFLKIRPRLHHETLRPNTRRSWNGDFSRQRSVSI